MLIKKIYIILVVCLIFTACSKNPAKSKISDLSNKELYKRGWEYYLTNDYANSVKYFNVLSNRPEFYLEGYQGLAWNYLKLNQPLNAKLYFNRFFDQDSLDLVLPSDSTYLDAKVGLAFSHQILGEHQSVISNTSSINAGWVFSHDSGLNYEDVVLCRAVSYYQLKQYSEALLMVKILDADFEADISFLEGRIALAQKIEELKIQLD